MKTFLSLVAAAAVAAPVGVEAQVVDSLAVSVRQVAGPDVYLDVGTGSGLAPGDTLPVAGKPGGETLGRLRVVAGTEVRSVLTFVGAPFPVSRGQTLILRLPRPVPPSSASAPPSGPTPGPAPESRSSHTRRREILEAPPLHGRLSIQVAALRSTTRVGDVVPSSLSRTFATPSFGASLRQDDFLGGFRFRTNFRMEYRYSGTDPILPATSTRIYTASLDREWRSIPLRMEVGRFASPAEAYSGFWDGAFLRYGRRSFGLGALVGFQPDRWDGSPSLARPKATGFLDAAVRGERWSWRGNLSAHLVRSTDSLPDHRLVGLSQSLRSARFSLTEDLQVDQDPESGRPRISNLRIRSSLALTPRLEARVGLSRRRRYQDWSPTPFVGERRDQVVVGLSFRGSGTSAAVDLSRTDSPAGPASLGYTGFVDRDVGGGLRARLRGSLWRRGSGSTLALSPGIVARWDRADLAVAYRFYRSDFLARRIDTHGGEATIRATLGDGVSATAQLGTRWSHTLGSQALRLGLVRTF